MCTCWYRAAGSRLPLWLPCSLQRTYSYFTEFEQDVELMFSNALIYNQPGSLLAETARVRKLRLCSRASAASPSLSLSVSLSLSLSHSRANASICPRVSPLSQTLRGKANAAIAKQRSKLPAEVLAPAAAVVALPVLPVAAPLPAPPSNAAVRCHCPWRSTTSTCSPILCTRSRLTSS
jgi:hypothetical protein